MSANNDKQLEYHFLKRKGIYISIKYGSNVYLLQVGLPVDQIGPHLRCLCSNDVGGDRSIYSPADIHPLKYLIQEKKYIYIY